MARTLEIPENLPACWPDQWFGETRLDCGFDAKLATAIYVSGGFPGPGHLANFSSIRSRWNELWLQAWRLTKRELKCPETIGFPATTIKLTLPDAPIAEGARWSLGFRFVKFDGAWEVSYRGWDPQLDDSAYVPKR